MTDEQRAAVAPQQMTAFAASPLQSEHPLALEIIKVLAPHPRGLRRWSVMRAIRNNRSLAAQEIPQKLEADIERVFRRFCAGTDANKGSAHHPLFFRPEEKAGEVWAAYPDRVKDWLALEPTENG